MLRITLLMGLVAGRTLPEEPVVPRFERAVAVDHDTVPEVWEAGTDGVFAILANDMDLDGDVDVLLNYHRAGIALFENRDSGFKVFEPSIAGSTRLGDGSGAVYFATDEDMLERIGSAATPGVYVWRLHRGWRVHTVHPEGRVEPVRLDLWAPRFGKTRGLDPAIFETRSATEATLTFDPAVETGVIELGGGHLELRPMGEDEAFPVFVGPAMREVNSRPVVLDHPDPHGVAWGQMWGSIHPDLFVSQGANVGGVVPPAVGKQNRHFEYQPEAEMPFAEQRGGVVPRDHGRTRRIEWVDIDNDGVSEAYLSNMSSSNGLMVRDPDSGTLRDVAGAIGVDFVRGATSAWVDVNRDSFQDLILYEGDEVPIVVMNEKGSAFSVPEEIRERLMTKETRDVGLWTSILALLDYNGDGTMDLWAGSSSGPHLLFSGSETGFAPEGPLLSRGATGARQDVLVFDANNDGWVDVLLVCDNPILYLNRVGQSLDPIMGAALFKEMPRRVLSGAVADMNGDGWLDLVFATAKQWLVMLNAGGAEDRALSVDLKPDPHAPVGALVRVEYSDGHRQVQRYGSSRNSRASQVLRPLHFGRSESDTFTALDVLWPGTTDWISYDVPPKGGSLVLSARDEE